MPAQGSVPRDPAALGLPRGARAPCVLWQRGQGRSGAAAPASLPAPPPAAPLKRPRGSPGTHGGQRSTMMLQLVLLAALALCGESRPEPSASAPPEGPGTPPGGADAVPLSAGRCSELDLDGMQRVVGGTEARSHAWPYQVGPAGVPRPGPGLSPRRDPALSPAPCLAPSPDLPAVLLQRQLAPHLRGLPHPEELGDDRRPLRQQVSGPETPPSSRQSSFPPKSFPRRNSGCRDHQSSRPWGAFGLLRQGLLGAPRERPLPARSLPDQLPLGLSGARG